MKKYIQQIIEIFAHNNYSPSTQRKVQQWLVDEEYAEDKNEALRELWQKAGEQKVPGEMRQSKKRMQQSIGMQTYCSYKMRSLLVWKAVSVVLLAVSAISIFLLLENDEDTHTNLIEYYMPTADVCELTLPDGTHVMLNSKSTLLYPKQFNGRTRSVYLIGEANFRVKPDKKYPFIVKGNDFQITALGTEFNVNAYPENNELVATLLEGSVKVEFNNLLSGIILKPNEQLIYNKCTRIHRLRTPRMDDVTAWQRDELLFSNMQLEDIITTLERKYPYTFIYSPHNLKNTHTYSFRFQSKAPLEEVMAIIAKVAGDIEYVMKEGKCYITKK